MTTFEIMSTGEVMAALNISRATANRLAQSGQIPSKKIGRYNVFSRSDVEKYAASREKQAAKNA